MNPIIQGLAGLFQRLKPKPKTQLGLPDLPEGGMLPDVGVPVGANQPAPPLPVAAPTAPAKGRYEDQIDELIAQFAQANKASQEAPPEIQGAKYDPIESILSAFTATQVRNPLAQSRALAYPGQAASGRAELANANSQNAWKSRVGAARETMQGSSQLAGMLLDRDAQTAKIEADLRKAEFNATAKEKLAMIRTNAQIGKAILELDGKGQLNPQALATVFAMNGVADAEQAAALAEATIADLQTNPNAWYGIQQAKLEQGQSKIDETRRTHLRDIVGKNASKTTLAEKIEAIEEMQRDFGMYQNQDAMALAQALTDDQKKVQAETKRIDADTKLKEATKKYTDQKSKYLPATVASNLAKGLAYIDHLRNQDQLDIEEFSFKQNKDIRDQQLEVYKFTLQGLQSTFANLTNDIVSMRAERRALEGILSDMVEKEAPEKDIRAMEAKIRDFDKSISAKLKVRNSIHEEADELRRKAREEDGLQSIEVAPIERTPAPDIGDTGAFNPPVGDDWVPPGANRNIGGGQPAKRPSSNSNRNSRNGSKKPKQNPPKPKQGGVTLPKGVTLRRGGG